MQIEAEPGNPEPDSSRKLLLIGLWSSAAWIAAMILYLLFIVGDWKDLRELDKVGSFLQGAFAPLAFGWLAIAVYLQKAELQQSTRALLLQADELKHVVEQHKDQTQLWRDERTSQSFKDEERRLEALIDDLLKHISRISSSVAVTFGDRDRPSWQPILGRSNEIDEAIGRARYDHGFMLVRSRVEALLRDHHGTPGLSCAPAVLVELQGIASGIENICRASDALQSDVIASRIRLSGLQEFRERIHEVLKLLQGKAR